MLLKYLISLFMLTSCNLNTNDTLINSDSVSKIYVENKTENNRIPSKILLTDDDEIDKIIDQVNDKKSITQPNIAVNTGYYHMVIEMKNKSYVVLDIVYTTYDGVVIHGSEDGIVMNKYYKNDRLEQQILYFFIQPNAGKNVQQN